MSLPFVVLPILTLGFTVAGVAYRSRAGRLIRAWVTDEGTVRWLAQRYWSDPIHSETHAAKASLTACPRRMWPVGGSAGCRPAFIAAMGAR